MKQIIIDIPEDRDEGNYLVSYVEEEIIIFDDICSDMDEVLDTVEEHLSSIKEYEEA